MGGFAFGCLLVMAVWTCVVYWGGFLRFPGLVCFLWGWCNIASAGFWLVFYYFELGSVGVVISLTVWFPGFCDLMVSVVGFERWIFVGVL